MKLSDVLSIRISRELKRTMKSIDIDWRKEIESFIRRRIREYLKERYLEKARKNKSRIPKLSISQSELIREDRDVR